MKDISWYKAFINENYEPENDLIALFYFEPRKGLSIERVAGAIASESSVGTWTTLPGMPEQRIKKLMAKVFYLKKHKKGYIAKIAYPLDLWEKGSIAQLMAGVAGNIYGMKALNNLRLIDISFPKQYLKAFKGPYYGTKIPKAIFKKKEKGAIITSTVIKPKVGYTDKEHGKIAYELYTGGIDCIKDDENLTDLSFNKFEKRVKALAKARDKAENETGDIKDAFINVTAPDLKALEKRIDLVHSYNFHYFMIDVIISGFTTVQTATEIAREYKMAIHAHRAMHAAITRNKKHGITMHLLAKIYRIMGIDQLHVGTAIGKLEGSKKEVLLNADALRKKEIEESDETLYQNYYHINTSLPVSSGGLHPGILPQLFDIFKVKKDNPLVIQVGGGTLGHPKGAKQGAKAVIEAIEAYKQGIDLREYAKTHKALKEALKKWGYLKPM